MVIICDGKGRRFLYPGTEGDVSVHDDADFSRVLMEAGAGLNMVYIVMPGAMADIGLTVDLDGKGAKYTKANKPVKILWQKEFATKQEAMKEEYRIKHKLSRQDKLKLIKTGSVS